MPVPLQDFIVTVNFFRHSALGDLRRPGAEPHAGAFVFHVALFLQQADHRIGRVFIELSAVRLFKPADVSREFDRRDLHAKTKAEIGNVVLASEFGRADFAFDAALAKTTGDQHTGDVFEMAVHAPLQRFRVDQFQFDAAILARPGMGERFVDALIRILQIDVFADDGDLDLLLRTHHALYKLPPVSQVRRRRIDVKQLADQVVEPLGIQHQGHLVNRVLHVPRFDDTPRRHVAEHR